MTANLKSLENQDSVVLIPCFLIPHDTGLVNSSA